MWGSAVADPVPPGNNTCRVASVDGASLPAPAHEHAGTPQMPARADASSAAASSDGRGGSGGGLPGPAGGSGEKRKSREAVRGASSADGQQSPASKRPADHVRTGAQGGAARLVPALGAGFMAPLGQSAALSNPLLQGGLTLSGGSWAVGGGKGGASSGSLHGHGGPDVLGVAANRRPQPLSASLLAESAGRMKVGAAGVVGMTSSANLVSMSQGWSLLGGQKHWQFDGRDR